MAASTALTGRQHNLLASVILLLYLHETVANWWLLGLQSSSQGAINLSPLSLKENCYRLGYLVDRQQQLCGLNENVITAVGLGAKMSIEECQHQFRMSRWNCTTFINTSSAFGEVLTIKSRETAFVHAISSAGVAYAITKSCSRGELTDCSCDNRIHLRKARKNWQWGGCSEDIQYGVKFSRDFVDSKENRDTPFGLMNLHNNEAGRRLVRSQMQRVCKCHGMSGSCSVRVCWRKLPSFRLIGDTLNSRYEGASYVKMVGDRSRNKHYKLKAAIREHKQPNRTELVYMEESPDYCERNETLRVLGTKGRLCNRGSLGLDGCRLLCCGRGYQTRLRDVEEKCKCRFFWCCRVDCEVCQYTKEEHICN